MARVLTEPNQPKRELLARQLESSVRYTKDAVCQSQSNGRGKKRLCYDRSIRLSWIKALQRPWRSSAAYVEGHIGGETDPACGRRRRRIKHATNGGRHPG